MSETGKAKARPRSIWRSAPKKTVLYDVAKHMPIISRFVIPFSEPMDEKEALKIIEAGRRLYPSIKKADSHLPYRRARVRFGIRQSRAKGFLLGTRAFIKPTNAPDRDALILSGRAGPAALARGVAKAALVTSWKPEHLHAHKMLVARPPGIVGMFLSEPIQTVASKRQSALVRRGGMIAGATLATLGAAPVVSAERALFDAARRILRAGVSDRQKLTAALRGLRVMHYGAVIPAIGVAAKQWADVGRFWHTPRTPHKRKGLGRVVNWVKAFVP